MTKFLDCPISDFSEIWYLILICLYLVGLILYSIQEEATIMLLRGNLQKKNCVQRHIRPLYVNLGGDIFLFLVWFRVWLSSALFGSVQFNLTPTTAVSKLMPIFLAKLWALIGENCKNVVVYPKKNF